MEAIMKVTVGTSFAKHETAPISTATTTPRQLLDQFDVDYYHGQTNFNGVPISEDALDKPLTWFAENYKKINDAPKLFILNVPKQDNAC